MVKPQARLNPIRTAVLGALIETVPASRKHKTLVDVVQPDGKVKVEVQETSISTGRALRFPLAQSMSEHNVDRLAARWAR